MSSKKYNRIKAVLTEKGKSSVFLSEELKVNPTTVSSWCTNRKQPSIESVLKIAEIMGAEMGELLSKRKDIRDI